jgi:hypothetical protein
MMIRSLVLTWVTTALVGLGVPATTTVALAQTRPAAVTETGRLNAEPLKPDDRKIIQGLLNGSAAFEPSQKPILDQFAKFLIYRLTWQEYQFKPFQADGGTSGETMKYLVDEVGKNLVFPRPNKPLNENQVRFMSEFAKSLAAAIKDVLGNEAAIARVNAAIAMSKLAETGIDEIADALTAIIDGKYEDAVKLYALAGLKNLYDAKFGDRVKDETRETKSLQALINFIQRKPPFDTNSKPLDEVEALRYVRREAIRALGQARVPAAGKERQVDAMPALELLRIVTNTATIDPRPSLSERVEAAVGLCQMQRRFWPERSEFQSEYAAHQVGKFVVEFANEYDKERGQTSATDWKHLAYRLTQGLAELKNETDGKFPYVDQVVNRGTAVLNGIIAGGGADQLGFRNWLDTNAPPKKELFANRPDTAVKPLDAAN